MFTEPPGDFVFEGKEVRLEGFSVAGEKERSCIPHRVAKGWFFQDAGEFPVGHGFKGRERSGCLEGFLKEAAEEIGILQGDDFKECGESQMRREKVERSPVFRERR